MHWRGGLATHVFDPIGWKIKGVAIGARLAEFRAGQWDDRETSRRRCSERLGRLLVHAATRVPFYAERVRGLSPDDILADPRGSLAEFPILEKEDLSEHFDELTCELGRGSWVNTSGGSTGTPTRFIQDKFYLGAALAATQLSFDWAGIERGDRRVSFWAAPRDFARRNSPVRHLSDFFYDRATLNAFQLGEQTMREYIRFMNRRRPLCLDGYTGALVALAEFAGREGLDLPTPRAVTTSSATLSPEMRETLELALRAPVFDRYGSREVGIAAVECDRHNGLHVISETSVFEMLDRDGREVAAGEGGDILVTNLWNYTMPFIRFRMGDHGVRGTDDCDCGRPYPMVDRIVGRTGAAFVRPDGGLVLADFFIRLFAVDFNTGDVRKYQFVQEEIDRVTVRLALWPGRDGPDAKMREAIADRVSDAMGVRCHVEFSIEDDIPPAPSGKHLYSVSRVSSDAR